jgi:hypothetical protein
VTAGSPSEFAGSAVLYDEILDRLPRQIQCAAYRVRPGRYRAICPDFSLIAESEVSLFDAQERLISQIADYVHDIVLEGFPPHLVQRGFSRGERTRLLALMACEGVAALVSSALPRVAGFGERAAWMQPLPQCV